MKEAAAKQRLHGPVEASSLDRELALRRLELEFELEVEKLETRRVKTCLSCRPTAWGTVAEDPAADDVGDPGGPELDDGRVSVHAGVRTSASWSAGRAQGVVDRRT